jgi:fatty-acyl-CoA synthase
MSEAGPDRGTAGPMPHPEAVSLGEALARVVDLPGGVRCIGSAGDGTLRPWGEVMGRAERCAARLASRGAAPGARVALLGSTSDGLLSALLGTWLTGAAVSVLPLPFRLGSLEDYVRETRDRLARLDPAVVVLDDALAPFLPPEIPGETVGLGRLLEEAARHPGGVRAHPARADDLAIVQFTSGSTSDPRAVCLPATAVMANVSAITAAVAYDPERDVNVSWLPLYHDMGLIGLTALSCLSGGQLVLMAPADFLSAPARWLDAIVDFGGTASAGPNFGYALAARALRRGPQRDLGGWRLAINGAETIEPAVTAELAAAGAAHGFDPKAQVAAYGLAEATLAVTLSPLGEGIRLERVERRALEEEGRALPLEGATGDAGAGGRDAFVELVRLGRPIGDVEVRIVDPATGAPCGERTVGEIEVRGSSVTTGYLHDPEGSAWIFHDGWLRTGDAGYLSDRELVVTGRLKDLIVVGGRNVAPEEVERAAGRVSGVRPGNVAAFSVPGRHGKERIVIAAETRERPPELAEEVRRAVLDAVGLPVTAVVLLSPGRLPKTTSGKLRRHEARRQYLAGTLAD